MPASVGDWPFQTHVSPGYSDTSTKDPSVRRIMGPFNFPIHDYFAIKTLRTSSNLLQIFSYPSLSHEVCQPAMSFTFVVEED